MSDAVAFNLAVIGTADYPNSHVDVLMARWFESVAQDRQWGWRGPRTRIASAYLAQFPANDLGRERFGRHGVALHDTLAGALRNGGERLAVDGVLLIAEHGDYPLNRLGQKLYPRSEMLHAIADVFVAEGRSVPVFCDKHLSWDFDLGRLMIERAGAVGFEILSSSSIPFCRYDPPVSCVGETVGRALAIYPLVDGGNPESYGYHSLEFVQQVLERRAGGAAGVVEVQGWSGAEVWLAAASGAFSRELFGAVWRRGAGEHRPVPGSGAPEATDWTTRAFKVRYADGLEVTHVGVEGWEEFAFGFEVNGCARVTVSRTGQGAAARYSNFAALARVVEDWFLEGVVPFPKERALLTCGTLQAMVQASALPSGTVFPTPYLADLSYTPSASPTGVDHWDPVVLPA